METLRQATPIDMKHRGNDSGVLKRLAQVAVAQPGKDFVDDCFRTCAFSPVWPMDCFETICWGKRGRKPYSYHWTSFSKNEFFLRGRSLIFFCQSSSDSHDNPRRWMLSLKQIGYFCSQGNRPTYSRSQTVRIKTLARLTANSCAFPIVLLENWDELHIT